MNGSPLAPGRIDYIDAIKGFSILWVVVFHFGYFGAELPEWLLTPYRMPLFFFMSGIFFRMRPFKPFFIRRINTLIIPFVAWYLLSWLFIIIKYELLGRILPIPFESNPATWGAGLQLLGVCKLSAEYPTTPFQLNGPLWFLIGLFHVQMIYYGLNKINNKKWWLLGSGLFLYIIGHTLERYGINSLFLIPYSCQFVIYYACGSLLGPKLIEALKAKRTEGILGTCALILLCCFSWIEVNPFRGYWGVSLNIRIACFIPLVFIVFQHIYRWGALRPLIFFGKNSLVVLATHYTLFSITATFALKIFSIFQTPEQIITSPPYYIVQFAVVCVINYFVIKLCNRYTPWIVGKKNLISYK